jgi:hypothetical protein
MGEEAARIAAVFVYKVKMKWQQETEGSSRIKRE